MQKSFIKSLVLAVVTGLTLTLSPSALAQIVTTGMSGTVRLARAELVAMGALVAQALQHENPPEVNAHLLDLKARIEFALDPRGASNKT